MRQEINWLNDAIANKDIVREMSHYCVQGKEIRATDGRLTAGYPWPQEGDFLVPGAELEKVLRRLPGEPTLKVKDGEVTISAGRLRGTIKTLPSTNWAYPGIEKGKWAPFPMDLLDLMVELRPFISDNAAQQWAMCTALQDGWAYATNNVAVAGAPHAALKGLQMLVPFWTVDFLHSRREGLKEWCATDHYVGFRWDNGAWMRSQLIVASFQEKAASMVQEAHKLKPTQEVAEEFKEAFDNVLNLTDDLVRVHKDKISGGFGSTVVEQITECEVPEGSEFSQWGAKFLAPVIANATHWQPSLWPKPTPWKGKRLAGWIAGRKM